MNIETIQYQGTDKYITLLGKKDEKYFALIALINDIKLNCETENTTCYGYNTPLFEIPISYSTGLELLFKKNPNNNTFFHFLTLKEKEDFQLVINVLECIYGTK